MVAWGRKAEFMPTNPKKYTGTYPIVYRSQWENTVMNVFDKHPLVLQWSSESKSIPYKHPFTGKMSMYIPDFTVVFLDKSGGKHVEMIEVKPAKEALQEHIKSKYDQMAFVINQSKWDAARKWCKRHGVQFRILTEFDIYKQFGGSK